MKSSDNKKKIHISDKELDRDISNLDLPEPDMSIVDIDDLDFYDDDMKEWIKNGRKEKS